MKEKLLLAAALCAVLSTVLIFLSMQGAPFSLLALSLFLVGCAYPKEFK